MWLTQSAPTNFHVFVKRRVLTPKETADDWKEVTDAEKAKLEASDAAWTRPSQDFIDRWNDACSIYTSNNGASYVFGQYNEESGFFELNEIYDIPYDEAVRILGFWSWGKNTDYCGNIARYIYNVRTLIPMRIIRGNGTSLYSAFNGCYGVETIRLLSQYGPTDYVQVSNWDWAFNANHKMRKIIGTMQCPATTNSATQPFANCENLEEIRIKDLRVSLTKAFTATPVLSYDSVNFMIANAANTTEITLGLHSKVYAAVVGDAEYPFNGGTREQWEQLAADAIEKSIILASA